MADNLALDNFRRWPQSTFNTLILTVHWRHHQDSNHEKSECELCSDIRHESIDDCGLCSEYKQLHETRSNAESELLQTILEFTQLELNGLIRELRLQICTDGCHSPDCILCYIDRDRMLCDGCMCTINIEDIFTFTCTVCKVTLKFCNETCGDTGIQTWDCICPMYAISDGSYSAWPGVCNTCAKSQNQSIVCPGGRQDHSMVNTHYRPLCSTCK
jgi:hypothetical protein